MSYKKIDDMVLKDGVICIPMDPKNKDYQEYLRWVEEGNEPEPQYTLEEKRDIVSKQINAWRLDALKNEDRIVEVYIDGVMVPFQIDPLSEEELNNALTLFSNPNVTPPADFTWRDANNVSHPTNGTDLLLQIADARAVQKKVIWEYSWELKELCYNASSIQDLDDIEWNLTL